MNLYFRVAYFISLFEIKLKIRILSFQICTRFYSSLFFSLTKLSS